MTQHLNRAFSVFNGVNFWQVIPNSNDYRFNKIKSILGFMHELPNTENKSLNLLTTTSDKTLTIGSSFLVSKVTCMHNVN